MTPNFADIQYFIEVAETLNISRASERLGITQPSLSAALKRLEDIIGTELLIRSRTGVTLTKAGKQFLNKSRVFVNDWEQLKAEVSKNEQDISGDFKLGCHPSLGLYSLSLFLPELIQKHKDLNIRLVHDLSRKITEGVISYDIDFGLTVNPVQHPDLVIRELFTDVVRFWKAKKNYPTQDLHSGEGVLICDTNLAQAQKMINDLKKQKIIFKRIITSSSLENITELTAMGAGVGIIPTRVAEKLEKTKLAPASSKLPTFNDKICLIYRPDYQKSMGAKTIIKLIRDRLN